MMVAKVRQVVEGTKDRTVSSEEIKAAQFYMRKDGSQVLCMRNSWLARVTGKSKGTRASDRTQGSAGGK